MSAIAFMLLMAIAFIAFSVLIDGVLHHDWDVVIKKVMGTLAIVGSLIWLTTNGLNMP